MRSNIKDETPFFGDKGFAVMGLDLDPLLLAPKYLEEKSRKLRIVRVDPQNTFASKTMMS